MTASEYASDIKKRAGISRRAAEVIARKGICSDDELRAQIDDQSILKGVGFGLGAFMKCKKLIGAQRALLDLADLVASGFIPWRNEFRRIPCIYALYLEGVLQYIGSTENLLIRIGQHIDEGEKRFDDVLFFELPEYCANSPQKRFQIEYTVISKLKPPLNNKGISNSSSSSKKYG